MSRLGGRGGDERGGYSLTTSGVRVDKFTAIHVNSGRLTLYHESGRVDEFQYRMIFITLLRLQ